MWSHCWNRLMNWTHKWLIACLVLKLVLLMLGRAVLHQSSIWNVLPQLRARERNLTLWEQLFCKYSFSVMFLFKSVLWGNCLDLPGEDKCFFFSFLCSLFSWNRRMLPLLILHHFSPPSNNPISALWAAGSPPLKLPLIPTMWRNTGLIKNPVWQEVFLFFWLPALRCRGVCCARKLAEVIDQNAIAPAKNHAFSMY